MWAMCLDACGLRTRAWRSCTAYGGRARVVGDSSIILPTVSILIHTCLAVGSYGVFCVGLFFLRICLGCRFSFSFWLTSTSTLVYPSTLILHDASASVP